MRDVYRRIALHGGITAIVLGIVGFMLAELASMWLAGSPGTRTHTGEPIATTDRDGSTSTTLRTRMPLVMAGLGFAFIAAGELLVHWWRGNRTPPAPPPPPDDAEKLLEELLSQVEAQQNCHAVSAPTSGQPVEQSAPTDAK